MLRIGIILLVISCLAGGGAAWAGSVLVVSLAFLVFLAGLALVTMSKTVGKNG